MIKHRKETLFVLTVLAFYILLSIILITHHEPWRDEAQNWLIARDAPNLSALLQQSPIEKTPMLWPLILYPFAKLGFPYYTQAILHHLFALAAVFLFLCYAPFSKPIKILFPLGYYLLYEYNVIAKNYALSVFLLFLLAHFYPQRHRSPYRYFLCLFFLANTHVIAFMISAILLGHALYEEIRTRAYRTSTYKKMLLILLALLILTMPLLQIRPSFSSSFSPTPITPTFEHLYDLFDPVVSAFIPITVPREPFWDRFGEKIVYNLVLYFSPISISKYLPALVFGSLLYLLSIVALYYEKNWNGFFIYLLSTLGILALFFAFYHEGGNRHYGFIFLSFIFALWISKNPKSRKKHAYAKFTTRFLYFILICGVIQAAIASYFDFHYPFSNGGKVHEFIQERHLNQALIMVYPSGPANAILPYGSYSFFCIESNETCGYHTLNLYLGEYKGIARNYIQNHRDQDLILITTRPEGIIHAFSDLEIQGALVNSFTNAITDDNYYIFIIYHE